VEIRDDGITLFSDYMPAGVYKYSYMARATTIGSFHDPAAKVYEMYSPDVFGSSASGKVVIK
ncbi:MAG TPA: hypothetical protein PLQ76_02160, partial [bacterium]|nr:hypothetical protein [bacterium]